MTPPFRLPGGVAELLVILDREWRQRIAPAGGRPPWVRAGTVALLGSAWATDEELTLYFVATRCGLSWLFFCGCWTARRGAEDAKARVEERRRPSA